MAARSLDQFLAGATAGDAITTQAFDIQRWLGGMGMESHVYARHIHESVADRVRPFASYHRRRRGDPVIYHHSIGSEVADSFIEWETPLLLIYHNVTPANFFVQADPTWVRLAQWGQQQLSRLKPMTRLAVADSTFNEQELKGAGYSSTAVLPISLHESEYAQPDDQRLSAYLRQSGPNLLFVGRISPNKKQEDLVKLLYFYRRIRPSARLFLVGDRWTVHYDKWVEQLAQECGVGGGVILTGKVSQQELVTYYRHTDLYVSMSEHEGFGKPLVESMLLGLPVLAYGVTAVPGTLGSAGVLFQRKDFERLAELVDILISENDLRHRIIDRQRERANAFLDAAVRPMFKQLIIQAFPTFQTFLEDQL